MPEVNNFSKINGVFKDSGEGDEDFYTYWYSVCYIIALLNITRQPLRDFEQFEDMFSKFLESRGIRYARGSSDNIIRYLFNNWISEINKRGTKLINSSKRDSSEVGRSNYIDTGDISTDTYNNSGIGLRAFSNELGGTLDGPLNLGKYHVIEFDFKRIYVDLVLQPVDSMLFSGQNESLEVYSSGAVQYGVQLLQFIYNCGGFSVQFGVYYHVDTLNHFKLIRNGNKLYWEKDSRAYQVNSLPISYDYSFDTLFPSTDLFDIANIKMTVKDSNFDNVHAYEWACNEGAGFLIESNLSPLFTAKLAIVPDTSWDSVWVREPLFNNTNYVGIDGELKRLLNYTYGEHLFELASVSELGWCLDISSPLSTEANIKNLNKAYEKGVVTKLSKYPLTFYSDTYPDVVDGRISYFAIDDREIGLNLSFVTNSYWRNMSDIKSRGLIPFIPIPLETGGVIEGYEVSFTIRHSVPVNVTFGMRLLDKDLKTLVNQTKSYVDDSNDIYFFESAAFIGGNYDCIVRGVYSQTKLSGVSNTTNLNIGNNLYGVSNSAAKYMLPIIIVENNSAEQQVTLKDIIMRPLSLGFEKGIITNKNNIIGYLKNNSGQNNSDIESFINDNLTPYNCVTNIQFL